MARLYLAQHPQADELLARDPLALLIGMVLDQQIPLEKAFMGPFRLAGMLGVEQLDAAVIASYDPDAFRALYATPPAIHRFPGSMAERTQKLAGVIVQRYAGAAADVWVGAKDGRDLRNRVRELPGFGDQKAQIFTALLGKQFEVQPEGWREAAGVFGEVGSLRSVADIVDAESLIKVREFKKQMKLTKD